jgi:EAL domain-containing protein (putative c-di-GMP-specific phosphodiesterase class I)
MPLLDASIPIERDVHVLRARRTAAKTRIAMGVIGVSLIAADPHMLPRPGFAIAGFVTVAFTAIVQLATLRPSWLSIEESFAGVAALLIIGVGDQHVTALSILWLAAISSGVMARGGRVHWFGSAIVLGSLALPVIREGSISGEYAAVCAAALGLLLTCGRLMQELNYMLQQARRQAESAETLLLAGDIAARMSGRGERAAADARRLPIKPDGRLSGEEMTNARDALARLIEGEGLSMVAQPIVDIRTGSVHAYEALARFGPQLPDSSPLQWFALAEELDQRAALERSCLRAALDLFARRPPGTSLAVNLSVAVLLDPRTLAILAEVGDHGPDSLRGLIIEVTEETLVNSDMQLRIALEPLRARGARLAVDDMGAGYSGLRQMTTVRPTYLKLDRSLVSGIDRDDERAALVGALAGYSRQVSSLLIAEGIETEAELRRLYKLGVPLAQGFYLSRPGPPWPEVSAEAIDVLADVAPIEVTAGVGVGADRRTALSTAV